MAEEGTTGAGEQNANGNPITPQIGVLAQYVKDLSFENPNAPAVFQWQTQPQIDVQFNIGAQPAGQDVHEVALKIDITATANEGVAFRLELLYGGLFAVKNLPEEQLQPFLYVEGPRLLFPFARRVITDMIMDGGFPPLPLDPIDFGSVYMQRLAQLQAQETSRQAPEETGNA